MSNKHILFFLHGMGKHDNTWHEAGLKVLQSAWQEYDNLKDLNFNELIEPVPLVYDDVFETWRQRMSADFAAFRTALLGGIAPEDVPNTNNLKKQIDKIEGWIGAGEPNFIWSHAMDVVMYRFLTLMRVPVDVSVYKQIIDKLAESSWTGWSIVAHSLGTSVAHNVLNTLYTTGLDGDPPFTTEQTRPQIIMMVANVSRILQRPGAKVYETPVHPGMSSIGAVCNYYLNVRHRLDPFTIPMAFDPDNWPSGATYSKDKYQHIRPSHIHFEKDELFKVHDFDHYLKNPRVHAALFRALAGKHSISDQELDDKKTEFDAAIVSSTLKQARSKLESKLPSVNSQLDVYINLFKKIFS